MSFLELRSRWAAFPRRLVSCDPAPLCRWWGDTWESHKQDTCVSWLFQVSKLFVSVSPRHQGAVSQWQRQGCRFEKKTCQNYTLDKEGYLLPLFHSVSGLKRTSWAEELLLCSVVPLCDTASISQRGPAACRIAAGRPFLLVLVKFITDRFTLSRSYISIVLQLEQSPSSSTHTRFYHLGVLIDTIPIVYSTAQYSQWCWTPEHLSRSLLHHLQMWLDLLREVPSCFLYSSCVFLLLKNLFVLITLRTVWCSYVCMKYYSWTTRGFHKHYFPTLEGNLCKSTNFE